MAQIEIISKIIFVAIAAFFNSLLSYFLDYCFWDRSIFKGWLPFLAKVNLRLFKPKDLKKYDSAKKNPEYGNMLIQEAEQMFLFKILGGCIICSNIWLGFITFTLVHYFFEIHILYALPYLLFSSFCLRKII